MDDLYGRIEQMCRGAGVNITTMCKGAGVPRSALSDYKAGRIKSLSADKLSKIAAYFDISMDYLIGNEKKEKPTISQDGGQKDVKDILLDVKSKAAQGITLMYNGKPINERTMRAFEASLEAAITLLDASQEE